MHTPLCHHAEGLPIEYAKTAIARGLPEIGISDHSPMPSSFDDWRMALEDLPRYYAMVDDARRAHPELPIRLGLEVDYFSDGHRWIEELSAMAPWDYLIGSVHYIAADWDVDNPRHISRIESYGVEATWRDYWAAYTACAASGLFDVLGHPDLPKKFGHRPAGDLARFYAPAIDAAAASGTAIEINTAGWHKDAAEQYPARRFLELMHAAGIPLSISSDAHEPGHVGRDFERAIALAREVGFTHTVRFVGRQRTLSPLP